MCCAQCQCFGFTRGLQPWVEHSKALLPVSLNKQEGIWCLLLLLANTALTVTATIITAISVVAINNTTVLAIEVCTITNAKKNQTPRQSWILRGSAYVLGAVTCIDILRGSGSIWNRAILEIIQITNSHGRAKRTCFTSMVDWGCLRHRGGKRGGGTSWMRGTPVSWCIYGDIVPNPLLACRTTYMALHLIFSTRSLPDR